MTDKMINQIVKTMLLIAVIFPVIGYAQGGKVRIHGVIDKLKSCSAEVRYDGLAAGVGTKRNFMMNLDENGHFDTTIIIEKPEYFRIERNILYLSPGDDIQCEIKQDDYEKSIFSGNGSGASNYLTWRLFTKGGSFLSGGIGVKDNFKATKAYIYERADLYSKRLKEFNGLTPKFKKMEEARITADIINSLYSYPSYAYKEFYSENQAEAYKKKTSFENLISKEVNTMLKKINKDDLLDVEAVRVCLLKYIDKNDGDSKLGNNIGVSITLEEMKQTRDLIGKIGYNTNIQCVKEAKEYLLKINTEEFKSELEFAIARVGDLLKGMPAFDFTLTTTDGQCVQLSSFKGKYIYIDFWATWCGPCMYESPYFEALAKKIGNDEIVFIPVSTDTSQKTWLNYLSKNKKELIQYNSNDPVLTEKWNIRGIPRFILIDKDFNIIDSNAPKPSEAKTEEILKKIF